MIAELERTVAMADGDLDTQIGRLSAFEGQIGADLAELRNLNADVGSQGEVSQQLQAIETERRANEARQRENQLLLKLLVAAKDDPRQLLATPNTLLVSQPAVSQLKNALVNAQIRTANLLGSRSEKHPFVVAARDAENLIRQQLNEEVAVAIRGLNVDIELSVDREESLAAKFSAARQRMSRLAEARAEYSNLVASVQNHTRLVEAARKNLADARARQAGANGASVITRIDGVEAGVRPVGPARKTVTAAGGLGGLLVGFGFIFLFANPFPVPAGRANAAEASVSFTDPVSTTDVHSSKNQAKQPARSATEAFGMFRGMSLQEAVRAVQQRAGIK
jgi:uncharacterized protein involved in exopolysaccharide biosynthesis